MKTLCGPLVFLHRLELVQVLVGEKYQGLIVGSRLLPRKIWKFRGELLGMELFGTYIRTLGKLFRIGEYRFLCGNRPKWVLLSFRCFPYSYLL